MSERLKYVKRADQTVVAVQLALDTADFTYQKWGGSQICKANDWIVNGGGDVYTVDASTFARTYRHVGAATYLKTTPVWAAVADIAGDVRTKEGVTHYEAGDYLVSNEEQGGDGYAVSVDTFDAMYERTA
jgi:hypothetical protein